MSRLTTFTPPRMNRWCSWRAWVFVASLLVYPLGHAQEVLTDLPSTSIGFQGLISAPSCAVTFNGQSSSSFTLRMPALSSDFFDSNQASAVSRFNIDIAVSANVEQPLTPAQTQCASLSSSPFQVQFDVDTSALTDNGKLKNALPPGSGSNILVEVLSFDDASPNFQVLDLRQSQVLSLTPTSSSAQKKNAQLQLGVRYVKDPQNEQGVLEGGFSAYLPFLLKYE